MRQVQVYKRAPLLDNDGQHHRIDGQGYINVQVPRFVGKFHRFAVLQDSDGEAFTHAVVEDGKGKVYEIYVQDIQFDDADPANLATHKVEVPATNGSLLDFGPPTAAYTQYYRYGPDNLAEILHHDVWIKAIASNYDLYSQKDKYIPL